MKNENDDNPNLDEVDKKISIIIPTFKERDNIQLLLERVHGSMIGRNYEVVIVDDNSKDGTIEIVNKFMTKYPVRLIVRTGVKGLATAVVEGFKHASGKVLVVMDADLQHPPESIKTLISEIENGSDIVIGSRYINSNGLDNFSLYRKMVSTGATAIARILIKKVANVKDIQSGFFALKRNVIENVDMNPVGYKILLEILSVGHYNTVKEVPYTFSVRENGQTKMNFAIMLEYILHIIMLFKKSEDGKRMTKYCSVGIVGIAINSIVLFSLTSVIGMFYILSAAIAHEVSIISNFLINNRWTFKGLTKSNDTPSVIKRALRYNVLKIGGIMMSIFLLFIFTEILSINYIIANIMSISVGVVWGYTTSISMVWRN